MKKKTYVLTLSKTFLKGHPREGQPTHFKEKYLAGEKIHTIRDSEYWGNVALDVNMGIAVLSIREWTGIPYGSKQFEIDVLEKLGYQSISIVRRGQLVIDGLDKSIYDLPTIAKNDGLDWNDFKNWFDLANNLHGGIVHFTDLIY